MAEGLLERPAERPELGAGQVQALQHDRRAARPLLEHTIDGERAGERRRPPGNVDGVVANRELLARLHEAEAGVAQAARADETLDLVLREEVVEASRLVALDHERPALPVRGEELGLTDGLEAARERAADAASCPRRRSPNRSRPSRCRRRPGLRPTARPG